MSASTPARQARVFTLSSVFMSLTGADRGAALDLHRSDHRVQSAGLVPGGDHGAARRRRRAFGPLLGVVPLVLLFEVSPRLPEPLRASARARLPAHRLLSAAGCDRIRRALARAKAVAQMNAWRRACSPSKDEPQIRRPASRSMTEFRSGRARSSGCSGQRIGQDDGAEHDQGRAGARAEHAPAWARTRRPAGVPHRAAGRRAHVPAGACFRVDEPRENVAAGLASARTAIGRDGVEGGDRLLERSASRAKPSGCGRTHLHRPEAARACACTRARAEAVVARRVAGGLNPSELAGARSN